MAARERCGLWRFNLWMDCREVIRRVDGRDASNINSRSYYRDSTGLRCIWLDEQHFHRIAHFEHANGRVGDQFAQDLRRVIVGEPEHIATLAFTNPAIGPKQNIRSTLVELSSPGLQQSQYRPWSGRVLQRSVGRTSDRPGVAQGVLREQSKRMDRTLLRPMRYGLGCMMEHPDDPSASYCMGPMPSAMWAWAARSALPIRTVMSPLALSPIRWAVMY